jgi:hypothetical protein
MICRQERLIIDLLNSGADTNEAEVLLTRLCASAQAMAEHEHAIEEQMQALEQE